MFWGCELHMQPGHPSLFSNWRVMFVVALPPSPPPSLAVFQPLFGFCSTNLTCKTKMGRNLPRESWGCLLFTKWRKKSQNYGKSWSEEQSRRPAGPHPGGDWNILELSQTSGRCWGALYPWLVRQLFLNWKLTVTRQQVGTFTTSWSLPSEQNPVILAH